MISSLNSVLFQYRRLSPDDKMLFNLAIVEMCIGSQGEEGEQLIASIPGIRKANRGNGVDFITRSNVNLEVKFSRCARAGTKTSPMDVWTWAHLDTQGREFDRLICIGKTREGGYQYFDLSWEEIAEFSGGEGYSEYIRMSVAPKKFNPKRLAFEQHRVTLAQLRRKYS
jgi:hypothetical protein